MTDDPEANNADMIDENPRNENDEEKEAVREEMNQQVQDADKLQNEDNGDDEQYRDYELDRAKFVSFTSEEGKVNANIYINREVNLQLNDAIFSK